MMAFANQHSGSTFALTYFRKTSTRKTHGNFLCLVHQTTNIKMTDYKEEQTNEIEALESIYPEELNGESRKLLYWAHIILEAGE